MIKFSKEKISSRVTRIYDGSGVCEYLIEGDERAVLIDTGYGVGDLKGFVESITTKPYDVVITHGHVDHAAGAQPFERVYMNLADEELFHEHCKLDFRKEMLERTDLKVQDEDFLPQRTAELMDLPDGMVLDLGNTTVRFIHVPGHTAGMTVPILEEEKTAFFGDACGVGVLLLLPECSTVAEYLKSLKNLQKNEPLYDKVLRQHGTCVSTPHVLEDNIENCEKILARTDDAYPGEYLNVPCFWAGEFDPDTKERLDGKEGNIAYTLDRIY